MRLADLDAVTVDGFGTILALESPVGRLQEALAGWSVLRAPAEIAEAFRAEVQHYRPRSHLAHDRQSLAALRSECVRVFLDRLAADVDPERFVDDFIASLVFRPIDGVAEALERLRTARLRIAVVSNWDCSLEATLDRIGLLRHVDTVVTSAEAGVPKPGPEPFLLALGRIGAVPARALHVGDEEEDESGARAAGMHFAPSPLAAVVQRLT